MPHTKTHDPSRTTTLRNKFAQSLRARFSKLNIDIITSIVTNDVFGLKRNPVFNPDSLQVNQPIPPGGLSGETDAEKLLSFQLWLQTEIDNNVLGIGIAAGIDVAGATVATLPIEAPGQFLNTFITSAYNKGRARALQEAGKAGILSETQAVSSAFAQGIPANRLAHLQQIVFTELKGVTDAMSQQISRELSLGLINGDGPRTIARNITKKVNDIGKKRATLIARTETIRAHHLGNIDTLEAAGVEGVKVLAEWVTAGDDRVCPNCDALQGQIFTLKEIRGLIPLHPLCRCVAVPAGVGETVRDDKGKVTIESREIEDIPKSDINSTDKEVQAILDKAQKAGDIKESEKIDILNNANNMIGNTVADILQAVREGINEAKKPPEIIKGKDGLHGYHGPRAKDGKAGDAGGEGVGISFIDNVGRDILFYMTNGKGYRLKNVIPKDGVDGEDAVGLKHIICNENKEVIVKLTDGTLQVIGRFEDGEDGKPGASIKNAFIKNQDLFIELTDGETINTGQILNPEEVVEQLKEFLDPISVVDADINDLGMLILELSNGETINAGRARAKTPDHQIDSQLGRFRFRKPDGRWGKWIEVPRRRGGGGGIGEAPIDGKQYARKDAAWTIITGGGGSGDMTKAVYDPASINEQLVGLIASQTLTNKTLTAPVINSPTGIVKADVGLGNVDNTSDADKPVSTAQQTALDLKEALANKGVNSGYSPLDASALVPLVHLPDSVKTGSEYKGAYNASTNTPTIINGTGSNGDYFRVSVAGSQDFGAGSITFFIGDIVVYNGTTLIWERIAGNPDLVQSVAGKQGVVTLDAADITDFDTEVSNNADVVLNIAKVTNANHTGDATGAIALTLANAAITGKSTVTVDGADFLLISQTSDSGNLKKILASDVIVGLDFYQSSQTAAASQDINSVAGIAISFGTTDKANAFVTDTSDTLKTIDEDGDYLVSFHLYALKTTNNTVNIAVGLRVNGVMSGKMLSGDISGPSTRPTFTVDATDRFFTFSATDTVEVVAIQIDGNNNPVDTVEESCWFTLKKV